MKIKILPISLVALFLIVFIIFFKGLKNSNIYVPNINLDKKIPFFSTELFDSNIKIHSNEIFVGDQFYLLNIWSSWCVPCRAEHVFLMDLGKEKNLKLVGLNYKDNVMNAKNFLSELNKLQDERINAFKEYIKDVEDKKFPSPDNLISMDENLLEESIKEIESMD